MTVSLLLAFLPVYAYAETEQDIQMNLESQAVVLLEGTTGEVVYEKNAYEELRPASITKIMTLLLIFEAINEGRLSLTDSVTVSAHAASMGGSQVFLEEGESQDVNTLLKCISIASANDACVAMAEHLAGSEDAFVQKMNERAKQLNMNNTNFVNCYGLDTDNHYTCAMDVALMSRELIMRHPEISNYSTVWMDTFTHTTRKGESVFGLTNTNKLIKSYDGITGLKTGSTSLAKYCLSATARRNNMDLIAVIMAAPDTKTRFREAAVLLNYGFANCRVYTDSVTGDMLPVMRVEGGTEEEVGLCTKSDFSKVFCNGEDLSGVTREIIIESESVKAPVSEGIVLGRAVYFYQGQQIGSVDIISAEAVDKADLADCFEKLLGMFFGGR